MTPRRSGLRRKGGVAVLVAMCLIPIIGVMAMVLDGGILMGQRRQIQAMADSAAIAAAYSLHKNYTTNHGTDPSGVAKSLGRAIASDNGYNNDGTTNTVTINIPPTSGLFSGKNGYAEAIVQYNQPRYFSAIWGSGTIAVSARSVARASDVAPSSSTAYSTASVLLLNPSSAGAFTISGGSKIAASGTVQIDSSNSNALTPSGGAYTSAAAINVVGNYTIPNGSYSTFFNVQPSVGQPVVSDPLSGLAAPSSTGMATGSSIPGNGTFSINPGYYSGGINIGGGATVTMNPGIYYINGNLNISGGATVTGSGVMIYMDYRSSGSVSLGDGSVDFSGGAKITLSAPTSGTYAGILLYQDRSNTNTLTISGGSATNMTGTIYAPAAPLSISGGAASSSYGSQLIAKTLNISGGANFAVNTVSSSSGGSTINVANYSSGTPSTPSAVVE